MPSDLQITNIRDQANANSAITIGSDGQITVNQNNPTLTLGTNATGFTGAKEVDFWKLNADNTDSSGTVLNSTLERVGSTNFEKIGTGMTKDGSGNFSFPSTGKYLIQTTGSFYSNSGGQQYGGLELNVTTNDSSYGYITNAYQGASTTAYYGQVSTFYFLDVTDISNVKVQFKKYVSHTNFKLRGVAAGNVVATAILFVRLGDT